MPRLAKSLVLLAAATVTGPALAADWNTSSPEEIYRGAYSVEPQDWTELGDDSDGVHMETGLRYWYSWGTQSFDVGGENFSATDNAHSVEAHLRIEDDATSTYAKAWAGYTAVITGEYSDPYESAPIVDGVLGYAGADFGWNAMSDGKGTGAGAFFGYNYWNNSPRTGRVNYSTVTGAGDISFDDTSGIWSLPGASVDDRLELHMLRLGISGKAEVSDFLDISAEVAAVPFATINGILGGHAGNSDGYLGPYPGCDVAPPDDRAAVAGSVGPRRSELLRSHRLAPGLHRDQEPVRALPLRSSGRADLRVLIDLRRTGSPLAPSGASG